MHYCLTGPLPTYLISEWRGLEDLEITRTLIGGINYVDPSGGECGVEGPIPAAWFAKESNLTKVDLSHNRLSGGLPVQLAAKWRNIDELILSNNRLSGDIPRAFQMT
ncbi:hypothetical protein OEZ86_004754 [Tetradesmus obliquus]|nr:hypothetical protein OEZ86_004754 [Tetradesmus obliquus]